MSIAREQFEKDYIKLNVDSIRCGYLSDFSIFKTEMYQNILRDSKSQPLFTSKTGSTFDAAQAPAPVSIPEPRQNYNDKPEGSGFVMKT
jgi:hypothetical protein